MTERLIRTAAIATLLALAPASFGQAADFPLNPSGYETTTLAPAPLYGLISEVRGGVFYHGYDTPEQGRGVDLNGEILSPRIVELNAGWWSYLVPRMHLGGNLNTDGRTSDGYLGWTWTVPVYRGLFAENLARRLLQRRPHAIRAAARLFGRGLPPDVPRIRFARLSVQPALERTRHRRTHLQRPPLRPQRRHDEFRRTAGLYVLIARRPGRPAAA